MSEGWKSEFCWSFSLRAHFESCRRHYFYYRFWDRDPKNKWKLYEMRNITTLVMLRGIVVHEVIAESLRAVKTGESLSLDDAVELVTAKMRQRMRESYYRLWDISNRPPGTKQSQFTNLLEHYYGFPDTEQRAREHRDIAQNCIRNLLHSTFWREIISTDHERWQTIDDRPFFFNVGEFRTCAKLDFAHCHSEPTIVDWKTGHAGTDDRLQLTFYSLCGECKWGWDPTRTRLIAVYLYPSLEIQEFKPTTDEVDRVVSLVKESCHQMSLLEPEPGEPADITRFPVTDDIWNCKWCRFQGICEGAQ
ncbi:MAG: PD-(D/E)XK nuclease family protein, partial [Armatimonadota bacterium]|nr:PD-(D/E)XK nuclease family protein [Armatimonadota bacterium]